MKDVLFQFYMHYGMWLTCIPLMVSLAISQEDIGKIKANLDTLLTSVKDLATQIAAVMVEQANQSRTLGILCSQQTEAARVQADHEERLRDHTKSLFILKEEVEEHDTAIKEIKAVVLSPKGKATDGDEGEGDQGRVSMPRWFIVLLVVISAIAGDVLLQYVIPMLAKP